MQVCPGCGEENPPKFRLCGYCGTPLAPVAPPQEVRKVVTILFCDLKGSTALGERLDSESLREVMSRYFDAMSAAISGHGGTIEKFIGDAVMAVFGIPRVHEDDALRAVRAANAMRAALAGLNEELSRVYGVRLENRTGVNTGEVVTGDVTSGQRLVTGDPVNTAARLEQAAGPMEVLLGDLTYRLVREHVDVEPVEPLELKGKAERVPAYRLVDVRQRRSAEPAAARLVGRAAEAAALDEALTDATDRRRCDLVLVTGDAGLGKSKLIDDFARRSGEHALVIRGGCLSYGDGITFWPLLEAVRDAAGIADEDDLAEAQAKLLDLVGPDNGDVAERLGAAVGLVARQYPLHEIFWAARKLVEILARRRPLVLALEDLHWAEPTLLDLVDALIEGVEDAPALVVAVGRPELLEARPAWSSRRHVALGALGEEDSAALIDRLLGGEPVEAAALARIAQAGEGNPLFLEQLVSMMRDERLLQRGDDGVWHLDDLPPGWVPPTIHALLSARLDSLAREERAVIDPASVIGYRFAAAALDELVDDFVREQVGGRIGDLMRKRFIRDDEPDLYRFDHILIRESVYDALLKRARASLHERFVVWADRVNGDRAVEFEEILGYHLEQAYRYLVELAPADEHALAIARDGARRLASAGRRAFERGDMPAASGLLLRATALLPPLDGDRLRLFPSLGEALIQVGEVERAESLLEDGLATAELAGEPALAAQVDVVRMLVRRFTSSDANWNEQAMETARAAIDACEAAGDHAGVARAWRLLGSVHGNACRLGDAIEALECALAFAQAADDVRQERRTGSVYALMLAYGPTPVPDAIERGEQIRLRVTGDRQAEAALLCVLGHLRALAGDFAGGRALMRESRGLFEELGLRVDAAMMSLQASHVEFLAGDAAAAEAELLRGYVVLDGLGDRYWLPSMAALLAQALHQQERDEEALAFTLAAEERARADDIDAQALWRSARAKLLAPTEPAQAEQLAQDAVALLAPTDAFVPKISALADLADVLTVVGRRNDALSTLEEALALAEAKRSAPLLARLRALVDALAAAPRA